MTAPPHPALLPAGLHDLLPPDAAAEAAIVEQLVGTFAAEGYRRVKPPLVEFEDNLLAGAGAALARDTFRLLDPASQRMMAVRADMTLQVARIARARLGHEPRPLRLSYAGDVLRIRGTQLRPERQFGQVGAELIGSLRPEADAEIVLLAAQALAALGVRHLSIDLCVPTLVPDLLDTLGVGEHERAALAHALTRKDAAAVAAVATPAAQLIGALLAVTGPAEPALVALARLELPPAVEPERRRLTEVARQVAAAAPGLMVTIDAVERRGFEYQTGVSFTAYARQVRGELGRGGRYRSAAHVSAGGTGEPAVGVTLFTDTILRAVPAPPADARLFLPHGTAPARAAELRAEGWVTVAALDPSASPGDEARRLGCDHLLTAEGPRPVGPVT